MASQPGLAPRRLLQNSGGFINTTLANRIRMRRQFAAGDTVEIPGGNALSVEQQRVNTCYQVVANDEIFDAREGEVMVSSHELTGFPNSRRAAVFSSLNGWKSGDTNPKVALHNSDFNFVGLCQNGFVSSNTALQEQGMTCQTSGIKTIINNSNETIHIGDRLMVDTMDALPQRKGIPNEKVTLVLRKVPQNYIPDTVRAAVKKAIPTAPDNVITQTILELRKAGKWVVGEAKSAARKGEQLDVLLTRPSFL